MGRDGIDRGYRERKRRVGAIIFDVINFNVVLVVALVVAVFGLESRAGWSDQDCR